MSYVDPKASGSFGGIQNVRRYGGEVKDLARNDASTLHKSARVRFRRRKTYSKGPVDLFQIDLADLDNISSHNDGYRYLLTCIDVFTKRAWAVPTKTKSGREVSRAFEKILTDGYKANMVLFCSLAVLDPRVGHIMDVLSPFIPVLCHSD